MIGRDLLPHINVGVTTTPELTKVNYLDMPPLLQGEFEAALSKDHLDLSLEIRNTHVACLMQGDLNTWARIAQRLEMARDILAAKHKAARAELESRLEHAHAEVQAAHRAARKWRSWFRGACAVIVLLLAVALTGCSDDPPTVTMPLSWCRDAPTGEWRHQHRSPHTTTTIINKVPHTIYHPSRDWDEQRYIRTCRAQDWRTDRKGKR